MNVKPKINVYDEDEDRAKYQIRYFKEDGIKALNGRLATLKHLFNGKINYPYSVRLLGFPLLTIENKEQHLGMIRELSQIMGVPHGN